MAERKRTLATTRSRRSDSVEVGTRYEGPEASPGFLLWQVATVWQRAVRAALAEVDLTHAQFVLLISTAWLQATARASGAPVTQTLISTHAKTDAVMTSEVLRTLERKALIERVPHPTDARAKQVVLTAAGKRLSRRAIVLVEAVDEKFFREPGEELRAMKRLLCEPSRSNS
jgi:DNA-binding MarR family transcriptional regulator